MEFLRARREKGDALGVKDPEPPESIEDIWTVAARVATVGIFVLLLGMSLYFCRPVLLPVVAALVIGTTLAPIVKAVARHRVSPWATAIVLGALLLGLGGTAVTLLSRPVSEWITRAPEIGAAIKQKLYVLDRPLAALRELQEVIMPSGNAVAVEPSQWGVIRIVGNAYANSGDPKYAQAMIRFVRSFYRTAARPLCTGRRGPGARGGISAGPNRGARRCRMFLVLSGEEPRGLWRRRSGHHQQCGNRRADRTTA